MRNLPFVPSTRVLRHARSSPPHCGGGKRHSGCTTIDFACKAVQRVLLLEAILEIEQPLPRFDDDDLGAGFELRELLGDERGRDAAADDENVAFVARHDQPLPSGAGG